MDEEAAGEQSAHHVLADEARPARHEDSLHHN